MQRFFERYGASPRHLVALVLGGLLSAYAVTRVTELDTVITIAIWLGGTLVAHDLILFPLYAAADRLLAGPRQRGQRVGAVPWINHVRIPIVISGLLLLVWFPLILRLAPGYEHATMRSDAPFMARWLVVTAVLLAGSAVIYGLRVLAAVRSRSAVDGEADHHRVT